MKQVQVRLATKEDRDTMIRLIKGYLDFYERPYPEDRQMHELLDTLDKHPERGVQFLAEVEGEAVGFATLYSTFSTLRAQKAMVMNDLFVVPNGRRQGVGSALLIACKSYVDQNEYAFLEWVTAEDNENAQRFYERMGANRSTWVTYSL